jgi:hypothetical protein
LGEILQWHRGVFRPAILLVDALIKHPEIPKRNKTERMEEVSLFMCVSIYLLFPCSLMIICTGPSRPDDTSGESAL